MLCSYFKLCFHIFYIVIPFKCNPQAATEIKWTSEYKKVDFEKAKDIISTLDYYILKIRDSKILNKGNICNDVFTNDISEIWLISRKHQILQHWNLPISYASSKK